jgi:ketosteroid isomerase-like protein
LSANAGAAPGWDEKGAAELKAITQKEIDAWTKQDVEAMSAPLSAKMLSAWDLGMGRPVNFANKAALNKHFNQTMMMAKAAGCTECCSFKTTALECRASGNLGVCTLEGEETMTMKNMAPMKLNLRTTEIFEKEGTAWKVIHHHGSLAKAPEMPVKTIATNAKSTAWVDAHDMPGVKMIPIWMNDSTMGSASLMKVTKEVKQPPHMNAFPMTVAVMEGMLATTDATGKLTEYGPGTVLYRPANEMHEMVMKPGLVLFTVTEGPPMMLDKEGKPLAPPPSH